MDANVRTLDAMNAQDKCCMPYSGKIGTKFMPRRETGGISHGFAPKLWLVNYNHHGQPWLGESRDCALYAAIPETGTDSFLEDAGA